MTPDRSQVSRDIGDSPVHVEASGGRPEGPHASVVRHRCRSRGGIGALRERRCREGGLEALEPRSRRPRPAAAYAEAVRERIVALRTELTAQGLVPAPTIVGTSSAKGSVRTRRSGEVLHAAGLVVPEPRKRRAARGPLEATDPNAVAVGRAHWRAARTATLVDPLPARSTAAALDGDDVVASFCGRAHWLRGTLTTRGLHLALHGWAQRLSTCSPTSVVKQKNGAPGHPQTQGKIERFHQTLKRWLAQRPAARTIPGCRPSSRPLGAEPTARPHRALGRRHPGRGLPGEPEGPPRRARRPRASAPALRPGRQGRPHHVAPGRSPAPPGDRGRPCPQARAWPSSMSARSRTCDRRTGEVLSTIGSRPSVTGATNDDRQLVHRLSPMSRLICHLCRDYAAAPQGFESPP